MLETSANWAEIAFKAQNGQIKWTITQWMNTDSLFSSYFVYILSTDFTKKLNTTKLKNRLP